MTTEKNFFVRQDVTGFFTMLQRDPARGGVGFGPGRGVGIIWGKMENFLPFCRFFAVWVGICISSRLCMILNITPTQQIRIPVKIIHIVI